MRCKFSKFSKNGGVQQKKKSFEGIFHGFTHSGTPTLNLHV